MMSWGWMLGALGVKPVTRGKMPRADRMVRICTDSRRIRRGDVFWALVGERHDAHAFVERALEEGAMAAVVNRLWTREEHPVLSARVLVPVTDTKEALLQLAGRHARRFRIPRIAVVGSNGKTTTKEMLARVMSARGPCHATEGNLNNQIGVPLTLLGLREEHRSAVVEIGTSAQGEVAPLSRATAPTCAVVTNIGPEHLEGLRDLDTVRDEELSVLDGLVKGGLLVLNGDDPMLRDVKPRGRFRVLTFGLQRGEVRPEDLSFDARGCGSFRVGRTQFRLRVPGDHNVLNALAAIAVGRAHRVPMNAICDALAGFRAVAGRMDSRSVAGFRLIDDTYNANPASMAAALGILARQKVRGRKLAVLAEMFELGEHSKEYHLSLGRLCAESGLDELWCVGPLSLETARGAVLGGMPAERVHHLPDRHGLVPALLPAVAHGDAVLLKGSHGTELHIAVREFRQAVESREVVH